MAYVRAEQTELDKKAMIRYAKKTGKEEGIEEGKKEGIEEGKGEKEIEIALKLKKLDFSLEQIAEITGMPLTKIKKL